MDQTLGKLSLEDAAGNIPPATENDDSTDSIQGIRLVDYQDESQLEHVMSLVGRDLSEPYSSR